MSTHLNCIDLSMQSKWVPTACLYKETDKQYTGCNLKTTELLDCALCAVIRSNTVVLLLVPQLFVHNKRKTSGLKPSTEMMDPSYSNLFTVSTDSRRTD